MVSQERAGYLYSVMRRAYDDLIDFIVDTPFRDVLQELYSLPQNERPEFVLSKILNREYLESRGISVPDGVLIQRSSFGDGRPTLFVVKKYLNDGDRDIWENVNITFDQAGSDQIRSPEVSWQKPLPTSVVAVAQSLGISESELQEMRSRP